MGVYAVSFTLKYDDDYKERYASLMEAIRAKGTAWVGTTSFAIVETAESLDTFEQRLWLSRFSSVKDALIVIDISHDTATCRGAVSEKATLLRLLSGIRQK